MSVHCPICQKECHEAWLRNHLVKEHNVNDIDRIVYMSKEINSLKWAKELPENVLRAFLIKSKEYNGLSKIYASQFCASYRHIAYVRSFDIEKDIALFFEKILPWKLSHRFACNNKELCKLECPDSEEQEQKVYQHFMLEKNPYYKHDGRLSPWSKDFNGYKGMTEEEKKAAVRKANKADEKEYSTRLDFYLNRGYSEKEAKEQLKKRQRTFTLEKCIEKYGEKAGRARWEERQRKWQNTLASKPIEEQKEINHKKATTLENMIRRHGIEKGQIRYKKWLNNVMSSNAGFSKISQELFEMIDNSIGEKAQTSKWLTKNGEAEIEVEIDGNKKWVRPDYLLNNRIIEFNGDYWHANPKFHNAEDTISGFRKIAIIAKDIWDYDSKRKESLEKLGYKVHIVWESDFHNNKEKIIQECKEFLGE